jgi:hypothetical protein
MYYSEMAVGIHWTPQSYNPEDRISLICTACSYRIAPTFPTGSLNLQGTNLTS